LPTPSEEPSDVGFLQEKESESIPPPATGILKIKKVEDIPGYVDPNANVSMPPHMRFSEQDEDYFNPKSKNSDPNIPGKEMEIIRQEGNDELIKVYRMA
jgi:hypothetical protein